MDDQQQRDEYPPEEPKEQRDGCGRIVLIFLATFGTLITASIIILH